MTQQQSSSPVVAVTGAGSGIGQGIAFRFAVAGHRVVVNDLTRERADVTVAEIVRRGGAAVACPGDVSDRGVADNLLATALGHFGRLDALVNNAGILTFSPLLDMTDDEWDRVMRVNVRSAYLCTQVVARHWVAEGVRGKVVNLASTQAEMASTMGLAHYCSSKGAVRMLTKVAALELAPHGINVNAIGPGTVMTGIVSGEATSGDDDAQPSEIVPLGRMGTPRDIANLALFLASEESSYITGQHILIDGGRNLTAGDPRPAVT